MALIAVASVRAFNFSPTLFAANSLNAATITPAPSAQQRMADMRMAVQARFNEAVQARRLVNYGVLIPDRLAMSQRFPAQ